MATYTSTSGYYTLKLEVTQKSQSVANNTSTLSWVLTLLTGATFFSGVRVGYTVRIDGRTVGSLNYSDAAAKSMNKNDSWQIASGTTTVTHNEDGTKTIAVGAITASLNTQTGNIVPNISLSNGKALTLTTIPRASTITTTAASDLMGTTRIITITRASSAFVHTLSYKFGNATGNIVTKTTGTTVNWTVPTTLAAQIASGAIKGSGTITCYTYASASSTTVIGTDRASFVAQIPPSAVTSSASSNLMGTTRTFTINRAAANLTHTLTYALGSGSGTIATKTTAASVDWTVPTSLAAYVPTNSIRATVTATITTYNGSAVVGTDTTTFLALIPPSTMTKATATMGISTSFTVTRAATKLSHSITYTFGSATGTAVSTSSNTSLSWTPLYSLAAQLDITGGVKSGTITYVLHTWNGTAEVGTRTYTATLKAPSASLSVPSAITMGVSTQFKVTEQASQFVHTVRARMISTLRTIATASAGTFSYSFPVGTWASEIPATKSHTVTIYHYCYSSSAESATLVAYNEYTTTVSVPDTPPTASISTAVVTSLASPFNSIYVQNNSRVRIMVDLSSPTFAFIESATATIDGVTKSFTISGNSASFTGLSVTSNNLATSGTRTITVKVKDRRGYSGTYTTTIPVVAYANPKLGAGTTGTAPIIERSDADGNYSESGAYLHINVGNTFSSVNGNNVGYIAYTIGTDSEVLLSSSSTSPLKINRVLLGTLSDAQSYTVTVRAYDKVGYSVTKTVKIPSLVVTLDLLSGGMGVGIGQFAGDYKTLEIAPDWGVQGRVYGLGWLPRITTGSVNDYYTPGRYAIFNSDLSNITNLPPVSVGGVLTVISSLGNAYYDIPSQTGVYFIQEFRTYSASQEWQRYIYINDSGQWVYGGWRRIYPQANASAVSLSYTSNSVFSNLSGFTLHQSGINCILVVAATPAAVSATSYTTIGTIPEGSRPKTQIFQTGNAQGSALNPYTFRINTDGSIAIYKATTSAQAIRTQIPYFTDL